MSNMRATVPVGILLDRAAGTVLGSAAGDALGSQYEFGGPLPDHVSPEFGWGVFGHGIGEWTDDTSMAIPILDALARGERLEDPDVRAGIVERWVDWSRTAPDVGVQTRSVLRQLHEPVSEPDVLAASRGVHERSGRSAGNGALMRTGPVALGFLDRDARELAEAARALSSLTHWEHDSGDACVLWSAAIRHAVRTGELDARAQVDLLPVERREYWQNLIDEAQAPDAHPRDFREQNGWVVRAFQGALAAVTGSVSLVDAIERAVRGGGDADTVAAIAGALAGAIHGGSALPLAWKRLLHGWPGYTGDDLVRQAVLAVRGGQTDGQGWPTAARMAQPGIPLEVAARGDAGTLVTHPHDAGVLLGSLATLDALPVEVDAVVSLCRIGAAQVRAGVESIPVWLIDQPGRNPNVDLVLAEAADMVATLRSEGKVVYLHCAEGRSRTSAVATLYGARHRGIPLDRAWRDLADTLPDFAPQRFLREAVGRIMELSPPMDPVP